ncbi:sulfotransferase domain-containing protein [Vibrio cyclitrophicus]
MRFSGLKIHIKNMVKRKVYSTTLVDNPQHDDIYIVEFPKSGVSWLSHIIGNLENILNGSDVKVNYYNQHKYVADVHQASNVAINRNCRERFFIKSHANFNPYYYFVVFLYRNPIDVMVSYFNFMKDNGHNLSFSEFIRDESYGINGWISHYKSWKYDENRAQRMIFVKYEDLIKDTELEIRKIYERLGLDLEFECLNLAIERSSLEVMKIEEEKYKSSNPNYNIGFVGKGGKIKKSDVLQKEDYNFIINALKIQGLEDLIDEFDI